MILDLGGYCLLTQIYLFLFINKSSYKTFNFFFTLKDAAGQYNVAEADRRHPADHLLDSCTFFQALDIVIVWKVNTQQIKEFAYIVWQVLIH